MLVCRTVSAWVVNSGEGKGGRGGVTHLQTCALAPCSKVQSLPYRHLTDVLHPPTLSVMIRKLLWKCNMKTRQRGKLAMVPYVTLSARNSKMSCKSHPALEQTHRSKILAHHIGLLHQASSPPGIKFAKQAPIVGDFSIHLSI